MANDTQDQTHSQENGEAQQGQDQASRLGGMQNESEQPQRQNREEDQQRAPRNPQNPQDEQSRLERRR